MPSIQAHVGPRAIIRLLYGAQSEFEVVEVLCWSEPESSTVFLGPRGPTYAVPTTNPISTAIIICHSLPREDQLLIKPLKINVDLSDWHMSAVTIYEQPPTGIS